MVKNTSVVLSMLWFSAMFIAGQSAPVETPAPIMGPPAPRPKMRFPELTRQKRTFFDGILGSRDWTPQFYHTWSLPTLPTVNLFDDEELHNSLRQRILELEIGQRRIIAYLRKIQAERSIQRPCTSSEVVTEPTPPKSTAAPPTNPPFTSPQPPQTIPTTTTTITSISEELPEDPVVTKTQEAPSVPLIDIRGGFEDDIINEGSGVEEQRPDGERISEVVPTTTVEAEPNPDVTTFKSGNSMEFNDVI